MLFFTEAFIKQLFTDQGILDGRFISFVLIESKKNFGIVKFVLQYHVLVGLREFYKEKIIKWLQSKVQHSLTSTESVRINDEFITELCHQLNVAAVLQESECYGDPSSIFTDAYNYAIPKAISQRDAVISDNALKCMFYGLSTGLKSQLNAALCKSPPKDSHFVTSSSLTWGNMLRDLQCYIGDVIQTKAAGIREHYHSETSTYDDSAEGSLKRLDILLPLEYFPGAFCHDSDNLIEVVYAVFAKIHADLEDKGESALILSRFLDEYGYLDRDNSDISRMENRFILFAGLRALLQRQASDDAGADFKFYLSDSDRQDSSLSSDASPSGEALQSNDKFCAALARMFLQNVIVALHNREAEQNHLQSMLDCKFYAAMQIIGEIQDNNMISKLLDYLNLPKTQALDDAEELEHAKELEDAEALKAAKELEDVEALKAAKCFLSLRPILEYLIDHGGVSMRQKIISKLEDKIELSDDQSDRALKIKIKYAIQSALTTSMRGLPSQEVRASDDVEDSPAEDDLQAFPFSHAFANHIVNQLNLYFVYGEKKVYMSTSGQYPGNAGIKISALDETYFHEVRGRIIESIKEEIMGISPFYSRRNGCVRLKSSFDRSGLMNPANQQILVNNVFDIVKNMNKQRGELHQFAPSYFDAVGPSEIKGAGIFGCGPQGTKRKLLLGTEHGGLTTHKHSRNGPLVCNAS